MTFLRILLFLLPLILFALWLMMRRRAQDKGGDVRQIDIQMALILVIAIVGVLGLAWIFSGNESGGRDSLYVAPKVVDGKVVPGHFVDPEKTGNKKEKEETTEEPNP